MYVPSFHSLVDCKLHQCQLLCNNSQHVVFGVGETLAEVNVPAAWLPLNGRVPCEVFDKIRLGKTGVQCR